MITITELEEILRTNQNRYNEFLASYARSEKDLVDRLAKADEIRVDYDSELEAKEQLILLKADLIPKIRGLRTTDSVEASKLTNQIKESEEEYEAIVSQNRLLSEDREFRWELEEKYDELRSEFEEKAPTLRLK